MDARQQEPQQGQAPPPPSWYPHPSPPPPFPYHHHQQQQYAPPPPPPQQQQQPYGHLHYPTPPHPQQQHPPPYPQQHPPNMAMPLPPPPSYHQPPPPYPAGPPRYPQPPPPHPGAPHGYPPPPPNQSWGNSPWHYLQHWENQDRNIDYNDEEDWAARARAWAAAKSITENSLSAQFTPIGRTEIQNHIQHGLFQQPAGPPGEALHSSLSANQHLSTVSDPQRWATHVKESSSYAADSQASHASTSEGLVAEDTTPKQVKYGSTSYFFEQEVPSSYSTIPEIGLEALALPMSRLLMAVGHDYYQKVNMKIHISHGGACIFMLGVLLSCDPVADVRLVAHTSYLFRAGGVNSDLIRVFNPAAEMLS